MKKSILVWVIAINFIFANNIFFSSQNVNPYLYKELFIKYFNNFINSYDKIFKKDKNNYNKIESLSEKYFNNDCLLILYHPILFSKIDSSKEMKKLPFTAPSIINEYMGVEAYVDTTYDMNESTCIVKEKNTKYQCVEFVERFYESIFHIPRYYVGYGANTARAYNNKEGYYNGVKIKTKYFQLTDEDIKKGRIIQDITMKSIGSIEGYKAYICEYKPKFNYIFENYKPIPGSIISFSPSTKNKYGHTAIVKYLKQVSSNKYIVGIIEQNYIYCGSKAIGVNRQLIFKKINDRWSISGIGNIKVVGWTIPFKMEEKKCIDRKDFATLLSLLFTKTLKKEDILKVKDKLIKIKNEKGEEFLRNFLKAKLNNNNLINSLIKWINGDINDEWMILHLNSIWNYYLPDQKVTKNLYNITFIRILSQGLKNETK